MSKNPLLPGKIFEQKSRNNPNESPAMMLFDQVDTDILQNVEEFCKQS